MKPYRGENLVGYCSRGYGKYWSFPKGCTGGKNKPWGRDVQSTARTGVPPVCQY